MPRRHFSEVAVLPWERRHRSMFERIGLFIAIGGALVIIAVIVTVLLTAPTNMPPAAH